MRILVSGGSGFIGSSFVRSAIGAGHTVLNLDLLTYAASERNLTEVENRSEYTFEKADIRDKPLCKKLVSSFEPDAIVHLAAETHVDRSIDGPEVFVETNAIGTFNLLEAARHFWTEKSKPSEFRFLHVSTDEVYGSINETGLTAEETAYAPQNPYAASKAAADHFVASWGNTYGLPVMITNCSNNYGMFQSPEKLVPKVIISALNQEQIPVYGDGSNQRDWLFVEDHTEGLMAVLNKGKPGRCYNISSRNGLKNIDLVKAICSAVDQLLDPPEPSETLIQFVPDRPGHDRRYAIDPSRIENELGWRSKTEFESGIRETVRWYTENRWWWDPLLQRENINQRMGLSV